ncbi:lysophospholipid acyltransferase family protein [Chitinilyticum piscinae]|uniref:Lysophospholipid acyltransferase family protein n=1 Tax=Chitinilyticum piscinae TaxID=2866724 RepID=A0A8J7K7B0_9NEIS|nr:lysophospholipid acyltransferase family protein [Chitinilyticum piscinae]MBE9607768.1 lysophospholipid acyltransferase family protein [Chitinilyticum piscinae]
MLLAIAKILARIPIPVLQGTGTLLGWLVWFASPSYRRKLRTNLEQSGIAKNERDYNRLLYSSIREHGRGALEILAHWMRPEHELVQLVDRNGWEHVENALGTGRPIIFLSPHLGALEMSGICIGVWVPRPMAPLYRPPKQSWLEPLMLYSRSRGPSTPAPADARGVRVLLKTLKSGGVTYLLPDQTPGEGEGAWASFFGKPAYTMTLWAKLARTSNAILLPCYTARTRAGRYEFRVRPFSGELNGEPAHDAELLNRNMELLIGEEPSQYLWSYNRYKRPKGAPQPESGA